uniref:Uncharacterized protein n=1 Tax=Candidatus Kentrum sp. LFY TaxID=2126342 RepID=A0A450UK94_9GAMM|nr:MAG: hypothetical protein BECKLFY1418B_GA0070995_104025 [Candidatus Kentron sp. LFY]
MSKWLLQWMAWPLQNPGAKMLSALNHARTCRNRKKQRPEGSTGRSMAIDSSIFRSASLRSGRVISQRALEDKFNPDWVDSILFVLAEEVISRQEMWRVRNLSSLRVRLQAGQA